MKKTKKILALLLVLLLAVSMFAACSNVDGRDEETGGKKVVKKVSDEDLVEDVANDFLEEYTALDSNCMDYLAEDSDAYDYADEIFSEFDGIDEFVDELFGYVGDSFEESGIPKEYSDQLIGLMTDIIEEALALTTYEVEEVTVDGDTATVEAVYTMANFDSFGESFENLGDEDFEELVLEYYSEDELVEALEDVTTEEEAIEVLFELIMPILEDEFEKELENIETDDYYITLELEKIDDEWLIVEISE